ncbi:general substrate transporter [Tribonema minus]|uniref:Hexose transporter 1 n=1 Tax=Tribonema minus TaxID=303371 RepID=A0A835ZBD5_9STRA|nr:general substrate transporter [Tribonema minus]
MLNSRRASERIPLLGDGNAFKGVNYGADGYCGWSAFTVFFFPALGGLLFGYDIGGTSAVLQQLVSSAVSGVTWSSAIKDSSVLQGAITSGGVLGAMAGSLVCFRVERHLGRRRELLLSSLLYFTGAAVEWASGLGSLSAGAGIGLLLTGRVVYGLGVGFAMHGAPAYIGEMSPPSIRGFLVGLKEAFIVVGILLGYIMGFAFEGTGGGWRVIYALAMGPAILQFAGMFLMPPSARWLVLVGRSDEARKSLAYVNPHVSDAALEEIQANTKLSSSFANYVTGQPSVLYYANTIFADVGLSSAASVLIGAFKLFATLGAVLSADKHGRKTLLRLGCWLMLAALLMLSAAFAFDYVSSEDCSQNTDEASASCAAFSDKCAFIPGCTCDTASAAADDCACCTGAGFDAQKGFILAAMFLYIGGYQAGFGPITWCLISEIFPLELRGKAISVAVVANFASNLLVTFFFPLEMDLIGVSATFLIFAALDIYALYFIATRVPETKGLSLEAIEALFQRIGGGEAVRGP